MQQHIMCLIISHQQQPMDPPDSYDEATQSAPYKPGPGPSNKRARETAACEADFITIGREIQNRYQLKLGTGMSESIKFQSYFGCGEEVAVILWTMLDAYSLLPDGAQILHLLWALFFMKVYPTESIGCAAAGGRGHAIDPKTFRNAIWPMIHAISDLEIYVVSKLWLIVVIPLSGSNLSLDQIWEQV